MQLSIDGGWLRDARIAVSPNCEPRPWDCEPALLVIHNISLPPGEYGGDCIEQFFCNCLDWDRHPFFEEIRDVRVSAHLLIRRDGEVIQFVNFGERAWHAGVSHFENRDNCNDFSIGIELEGTDEDPYSAEQYVALTDVTAALMEVYPQLTPERIVGHSDIAPGRKTDPGEAFNWARYREALKEARQ